MDIIFEDSVDFRSCGPQLFNHKVKLPFTAEELRLRDCQLRRQVRERLMYRQEARLRQFRFRKAPAASLFFV